MSNKNELSFFIIRLVLGLTFFAHGLGKFQDGIHNTENFFNSLGIFDWLAYPVAILELVGGILVILGLGTRIISTLFSLLIAGAIITVKFDQGFIGGYEFDLLLLAVSLFFVVNNNQSISLDQFLSNRNNKQQQTL
ncbi:DoxX family protein [Bacillus cereus]|uniref:DoxX family protein n=1 Tax=Bacillus cereus group TaxID=86661 RepID=UPI000B4C1707|nr:MULTISPECIES: DoxX family protein [Bacillus cereus group]MEC3196898.1 DoxX family protein [Bacillus cereus]QFQ28602.1 DoxX family protein [Bacillus thuringiensis]WJX08288.1 DoxX family protein [Bacillus cereus]